MRVVVEQLTSKHVAAIANTFDKLFTELSMFADGHWNATSVVSSLRLASDCVY